MIKSIDESMALKANKVVVDEILGTQKKMATQKMIEALESRIQGEIYD
jgi:hypothetical protein